MHRAVARYTAPVALLLALTVMPALAAGEAQRVTGGGWIEPSYFNPSPPTETGPILPPDVEEASVFTATKNKKCTFGFVAWRTATTTPDQWEYDGELTFHDHGKGMKLKSLQIDFVEFDLTTKTAVFQGMCEVRTASAAPETRSFIVMVVVDDAPSARDFFRIALPDYTLPTETTAYGAEGTLGGGSIQIHVRD